MEESDDGYITLNDVLVLHVTDAAALVEVDGDPHWIPLSVIRDEAAEADRNNLQDLDVKEWFLRKEEII